MFQLKKLILPLFLISCVMVYAQNGKKSMTFDDLVHWQRITEKVISDNGKWVACKMEPWKGDSKIFIYNERGEEVKTFEPAGKIAFSPSSGYLIATLFPTLEETETLKLKKTKKEDMPLNSLFIYDLSGKEEKIDSICSYKFSTHTDWLAYQQKNGKDSVLVIRSLNGAEKISFPNGTEYGFAEKGSSLFYLLKEESEEKKNRLFIYNLDKRTSTVVYEGTGSFKQITFNKEGDKLAFLYTPEKEAGNKGYSLFISEKNNLAQLLTDGSDAVIEKDLFISEHEKLRFSDNSQRLFFNLSPIPQEKDTTVLAENRPSVQVWTWNEEVLHTQQTKTKNKDLKQSYTTLYDLSAKKIIPLTNSQIPDIVTTKDGNAPFALLVSGKPYPVERMWRGKQKRDFYKVDLQTGKKELIIEGSIDLVLLSPESKYAYWYCLEDSTWNTCSLLTGQKYKLTSPSNFIAWNTKNDVPDYPSSLGIAGWTKGDKTILINEEFDIWEFDPEGKKATNLTLNGKEQKIRYRLVELEKEKKYIDKSKTQILTGYNEYTKGEGYYLSKLSSPAVPKRKLVGNVSLSTPIKAKKADKIIYTWETFEQYPDLYVDNLHIEDPLPLPIRLTEGYKQQENILWGTTELISWTSLDGKKLEGVIYKPENFDPTKKYPMIVNFYERNSETLHNYRMPEPHRSTIDYHFYLSHGYIIFNPDIVYEEGYPGQSCFNSVMPGISAIISKGYIDEKRIGAQGHSWGGYQVAYLATRTNLFAAIESGAPVVNMFSAYGGIRWETGLSRMYQYEHGQSRIGGTIWEQPLRFFENSPLFTMDKVETPILIMHNDADGHVPWYQGIEYFVALRRLQKPAWLLNYPGEPHWPMKIANKIDFQQRMFQFFEHYLNGKPMPEWMVDGVPAIEEDFKLGL